MRGLVNPDMVLIGEGSEEIGAWLEDLYVGVCDNKPSVHRMSPESAEITKLSINCFITTKIAFAYADNKYHADMLGTWLVTQPVALLELMLQPSSGL
jgi:UDP-glucose 6-dehydrogenase